VSADVHCFAVAGVLRSLERHCARTDGLLDGLEITPQHLLPPYGWCSWDDYAVFLARTREAVGGPAELESLIGDAIATNPVLTVLASTLVEPRRLYTDFIESVGHRLCRCVGARVRTLPDGRIALSYRLADGYRPCRDYFVASRGGLQGLPRLLGAEVAVVEAEMTGVRAEYLVTPPAPRTVASRLGRTLSALSPWRWSPADFGQDDAWEAVRGAMEIARLEIALRQTLDDVGRTMAASSSTAELFDRLVTFLEQHFCCAAVGLWSKPGPGADLKLLHAYGSLGTDDQPRFARDLVVEGRVVGRVEADLSATSDEGLVACLESLLSWAAIGLSNCLGADAAGNGEASSLVAPPLRHKLPRRQRQVADLVVQGLSNRHIAEALKLNVKTVEAHVARLMRKVDVSTRAALAAKLSQLG
jgi:DNA-binding CsgD family transcriptional regulator